MIDIALDDSFNLYPDGRGGISLVNNLQQISQHVKQRLNSFTNEWFLDSAAGFDWFGTVFRQPYSEILAESEIKRRILATEGVAELTSFSVNLDKLNRTVTYLAAGIVTDSGDIGEVIL